VSISEYPKFPPQNFQEYRHIHRHPFLNTAEFLAELERYTYIELAARNEDGRHIDHEPFG
jgi:hypothetical protein